ncbi:MAG TPA: lipopolysaccharide assembly protein LapA domain-containing protein [Cellulomonas sp.]
MPVQRSSTPPPGSDPVRPLPDGYRPTSAGTGERPRKTERTRTGAAWVGICVGALVLIALVVFMLQNTAPVEVAFLGMTGTAPLALVLLIAGLGVGLVALVVGGLRIAQLRRRIRTDQHAALPRSRTTL